VFVEVTVSDPSDFETALDVNGEIMYARYRVLTCRARRCPTRSRPCCSHVREETGRVPHSYFEWTEGSPLANLLRFLFFGVGEVAPVTRECCGRPSPTATAAARARRLIGVVRG
jgi:hypothetical protein